jgi:hypothetical protein
MICAPDITARCIASATASRSGMPLEFVVLATMREQYQQTPATPFALAFGYPGVENAGAFVAAMIPAV